MGMITKVRTVERSREGCEYMWMCACVCMLGGEGEVAKEDERFFRHLGVVSCSMSLWKFDLEQDKSGFRIRSQGKSQNLGSIYLEEG